MSAPSADFSRRPETEVAPVDSYRPGDPVWVYRQQNWRAGVIEQVSPLAATVTYRPNNARGTAVDTVTARNLVRRIDTDPQIDRGPQR